MRRTTLTIATTLAVALCATMAWAEPHDYGRGGRVAQFLDENCDGFNDLAPDSDMDGIPDGLDPDYTPGAHVDQAGSPEDGPAWNRWRYMIIWAPFGPFLTDLGDPAGWNPGDCGGGTDEGSGLGQGPGPGGGTGGVGHGEHPGRPPDRGNPR